jgi:hypothetical protein
MSNPHLIHLPQSGEKYGRAYTDVLQTALVLKFTVNLSIYIYLLSVSPYSFFYSFFTIFPLSR